MTTKKAETSTARYAGLYADFAAQCEVVYANEMPQEERDEAIEAIKKELAQDPKYATLVRHNFCLPSTPSRRVSQANLDAIVKNLG